MNLKVTLYAGDFVTSNFLQNFNSKNDKSRIHTVSVKSIQNFFLLNLHTVTTPTSLYVN